MQFINQMFSEKGYGIIENLVAGVLLTAVLAPLFFLAVRYSSVSSTTILFQAGLLAQHEMEEMTATEDYRSDSRVIKWQNREWRIERRVQQNWQLLELTVRVKPANQPAWSVEFFTCRSLQKNKTDLLWSR